MREIEVKTTKLNLAIVIGLVLILCCGVFMIGFYVGNGYTQFNKYSLFGEAYGILEKSFLGQLPSSTDLQYDMIEGVLQKLNDPYTVLVEPPQHELQSDQLAGQYGGIGARVEQDSSGLFRIYPYDGSPAAEAGLQDGDILLQIDQLQVNTDTTSDQVQAALRGKVGSSVKLLIRRDVTGEQLTVSVKRQEIPLPSVTWNLLAEDKQVGLVQVNVIAATTPDEIQKAISDLQSQGAVDFVLDLRDNGGGLVDAGIKIAKLFLKSGVPIMDQQYKDKPVDSFSTTDDGPFAGLPLFVFVNHNTASAAEIITGALQVNSRALVIGQPTYGKDSIQLVYDLSDGASLHVTSAKWWVPGLNPPISGNGIQPDVNIANDPAGTLNTRYINALVTAISK